jgi:dihydrolipoamide dehydrogenase
VTGAVSVDYAVMAERKDAIVNRLRKGVEGLVKGRKITLIAGEAELTGGLTFRAGNDNYAARNIVIATGSEPASIPVPGADRPEVINSDTFLALKELPASAVIIGGGVIGVEFATLLNALGSKVTIIEMLPKILNELDEDLSASMSKILAKRGVEIHTAAKLKEVREGGVCIYEEGGAEKQAGKVGVSGIVIMAVGRRPVTKMLGLEKAGITANRGFVTVDDCLRTNVAGVYAIGDVTGKLQLAHVASAQALVAAAHIAGKKTAMRYDIVPACVYTNPEIAAVGRTEAQVKAASIPYNRGFFPAAANGRSMIMNATEGFVKLLTHKKTGEILGAAIMGSRATDMIAEIAAAMNAEATIEELAATIHAHPTHSEMILEAAHDVEGICCHKL